MRRTRRRIVLIFTIAAVVMLMLTVSSYAASAPYATGLINAKSGAVLRKSSNATSKSLGIIKDNTTVTITKEVFKSKTSTKAKYRWYYVTYGSKKGYIRADIIDNIKYTAASGKITGKVNYRVGAGTKMKLKGSLSKGKAVTIYLKAQPVSSTKGSSSTWYKIKVGSSYRYVCSAYVDIVGSIFSNNVSTGDSSGSSSGSDTPSVTPDSNKFAKMSDSEFDDYLTKQGFTSAYKTKIKALHKAHPNWVFIGKKTGISWDTAVSKESANGVSLIQAGQPLSQRATDSKSFTSGTRALYKTASTSNKIGTVKNKTAFTLMSEVWSGSTQWNYIKLSDGTKGYCKGALYTQEYSSSIEGTTTADGGLNMRKGAYTSATILKTLAKGTEVNIVLQCKGSDGNTWYKIRNGNEYGYVSAEYIKVNSTVSTVQKTTTVTPSSKYPTATAKADVEYRSVPRSEFAASGAFSKDTVLTLTAKVTDAEGIVWYKAYNEGSIVYVLGDNLSIDGKPAEADYPAVIKGVTNTSVNYRKGAGTDYALVDTFGSGKELTVLGAVMNGSDQWYAVDVSDKKYYVCAEYVNIVEEAAPSDAAPVTKTVENNVTTTAKPSSLTGKATILEGTWIAKDGSTWFNANSQTVAYYMDPRNFLNEDRVYMFEDLSYQKDYQTSAVVTKVLNGTKLPGYGFSSKLFMDAGSTYGISPVFLAARARQETGGGSIAISGYVYNGKTVYNPFNIGATSSSNPVMNGIKYAYNKGWTTQKKAVNGSASYLASGYINAGQNSIYYQRFNVANGSSKLATHQYMTNIMAPYSEAYTTKTSYKSFGICDEPLTFSIPIYNGMPSSTSLPK